MAGRAKAGEIFLAVDQGNSGVKCSLFDRAGNIAWRGRCADGEGIAALLSRETRGDKAPGAAALASVVPARQEALAGEIESVLGFPPRILGRRDIPVRTLAEVPDEVGLDRLLNAAAVGLLGLPAVVIDCGTALTLDLVNAEGEHEGGIIIPSPTTARDCLAGKTALLPRPELVAPGSVVGRNTTACLLSGLVLGWAEMVNGLLRRISGEWRKDYLLATTGGGIELLLPYLPDKTIRDRDLTARGIRLSAKK